MTALPREEWPRAVANAISESRLTLRDGLVLEEAVGIVCALLEKCQRTAAQPWYLWKPGQLEKPSRADRRTYERRTKRAFPLPRNQLVKPEHNAALLEFFAYGGPEQRFDGMLSNVIARISGASFKVKPRYGGAVPPSIVAACAFAKILGRSRTPESVEMNWRRLRMLR